MKIYSRYTHGLLLYHSLSYSRRKRSASFNVYIEADNQHGKSSHGFGQILFFFYVHNRPFCLLRRFLPSTKRFSSLLRSSNETPKWDTYLDKYYSIVCPSMSSIVICPCSFIVSKCLIFPYDEKYSVCTPIELELEHDWWWTNVFFYRILLCSVLLDLDWDSRCLRLRSLSVDSCPSISHVVPFRFADTWCL
jgi:hypothetical protein